MNMIPGQVIENGRIQLETGDQINANLKANPGHKVTVGVRPEDLSTDAPEHLLEGQVSVREPLGHETLIYVNTPVGEFIAKADGRYPPDVGATVRLGALQDNLHVFDAETGSSLA